MCPLAVGDAVPYESGRDQDLNAGDAARPVRARYEPLREGGPEYAGELQTHMGLLMWRKDRNDSVDRLGRVERVQRGKHQMACFGRQEGRFNGFVISHFTDQAHIRILPQAGSKGVSEGTGIDRHLSLVDDAPIVAVHVLDWILDGHDVRGTVSIDVVDHPRERRSLTAPRRAGHKHQATRFHRDTLDHCREVQLVQRRHAYRDDAKDQRERPALLKYVAAKAAETGHAL